MIAGVAFVLALLSALAALYALGQARRARRSAADAWGDAMGALSRAVADADPARGVEVEVPPWEPR